ncbi:hypothetical protein, partial [Klebsiella pneumoniae]|uniref:hypothetical protein n=1 Tax=Klebsiella pneumoniae TaxID=573 RepID=UPI00272EF008
TKIGDAILFTGAFTALSGLVRPARSTPSATVGRQGQRPTWLGLNQETELDAREGSFRRHGR